MWLYFRLVRRCSSYIHIFTPQNWMKNDECQLQVTLFLRSRNEWGLLSPMFKDCGSYFPAITSLFSVHTLHVVNASISNRKLWKVISHQTLLIVFNLVISAKPQGSPLSRAHISIKWADVRVWYYVPLRTEAVPSVRDLSVTSSKRDH